MRGCTFAEESGHAIGNAFASADTLKCVMLDNTFQDKPFCDALVESLAVNHSIDRAVFANPRGSQVLDAVETIKTLAQRNDTLKVIIVRGGFAPLTETNKQEIQHSLGQNYTLEQIHYEGRQEYFQAITGLNAAGREYLAEEPTNASKCIAVLAKVKNDLDCLYYHMRENPLLCISYCNSQ